MKLFEKNNRLDEMQEKKLLVIESRGFWLVWGALLVSLMAQLAVNAPAAQMLPEGILFIGSSLYALICCLHDGIWDRHIVPTVAGNVVCSLAGGAAVLLYAAVRMKVQYDVPLWVCLAGGAISGVWTAALILILLQISLAAYSKRRKRLESEEEQE